MKHKKIYIENDGKILELNDYSKNEIAEVEALIEWVTSNKDENRKVIGFNNNRC